jgi:hypothetical protein
VNGTPAFLLGTIAGDGAVHLKKRINGLVPFDVLAREIDAIRAASGMRPADRRIERWDGATAALMHLDGMILPLMRYTRAAPT